MITIKHALSLSCLLCAALCAGCGGETQQKQDRNFFTSGNPAADQRAGQRMAKAQQLSGSTGATDESTGSKPAKAPEKKSLYDRLGGEKHLAEMVDDFVTRALADPRVNWDRKGVLHGGFSTHHNQSMEWAETQENVKQLKIHLTQFLCLATGGPTTYQGKEVGQAHAHMHITNPEFDAAVGDLKATLDKFQIPNPEQKELLSIIESTREQIVEER